MLNELIKRNKHKKDIRHCTKKYKYKKKILARKCTLAQETGQISRKNTAINP